MSKLKKLAEQDTETRTYNITGYPEQLDIIEQMFNLMNYCGKSGASRTFNIWYDGDGGARLQFERDGKEKLVSTEEQIQQIDDGSPASFCID